MTQAIKRTDKKNRIGPSFPDTQALSLSETRKKIKLPVFREDMLSVKNRLPSSYQMVLLKSGRELNCLGEVKADRPFILHEELMDWLCEEFDKLGIEFKLRIHSLSQGKFSLYQQYLFNFDIETPDHLYVNPLIFIKNSFVVGSAFELHFGTYRYICTNGAIHEEKELTHITANSKNWNSIRGNGLTGKFEAALNSYVSISDFFRNLYSMSLSDKFEKLFSPGLLPIGIRKQVLASLELSHDIAVNIDVPKKNVKVKSRYLKEEDFVNIGKSITLTGDLSMWDVYNRFTSYSSNQLNSGSGELNANLHIDKAFSIIAERKKSAKHKNVIQL